MSMNWRNSTVNSLLDEIEIWKQKEIDHRAILDDMVARSACSTDVTLHAIDNMKNVIENDIYQRHLKETDVMGLCTQV